MTERMIQMNEFYVTEVYDRHGIRRTSLPENFISVSNEELYQTFLTRIENWKLKTKWCSDFFFINLSHVLVVYRTIAYSLETSVL